MVDPMNTNLFTDLAGGNIYLKRINNNGQAEFYTFKLETAAPEKEDPFVNINARLTNIEKLLEAKNVQSTSNNAARPPPHDAGVGRLLGHAKTVAVILISL